MPKEKETLQKHLIAILVFVGLIWLRSSLQKLQSGNFISTLAPTLEKFASKNPYPWYKNLLQNVALANAQIFALLVLLGELFSALAITIATFALILNFENKKFFLILLILGLTSGLILNLNFYLASGWTSPSTDTLNLLMLAIQAIGLLYSLRYLRSVR